MSIYRRYRLGFNLLGLVLLAGLILLFKIDLRQTAVYLTRADPWAVLAAVVLFLPFLLLKAWRWQVILSDLEVPVGFGEASKLYALGLGAGTITPGQLGDTVKILYFRGRGMGAAALSVLLDRIWDLVLLLLVATFSSLAFVQDLQNEWLAFGLLSLGAIVFLLFALNPGAQRFFLRQLIRRTPLQGSGLSPDQIRWSRLTPGQIILQFALSLAAAVVVYVRFYLLTTALDLGLDLVPFIALISLSSVAALLPISISGIGARDAALVLLAPVVGVAREQALGLSALILLIQAVNGLVGFVVWSVWGQPGDAEKRKRAEGERQETRAR